MKSSLMIGVIALTCLLGFVLGAPTGQEDDKDELEMKKLIEQLTEMIKTGDVKTVMQSMLDQEAEGSSKELLKKVVNNGALEKVLKGLVKSGDAQKMVDMAKKGGKKAEIMGVLFQNQEFQTMVQTFMKSGDMSSMMGNIGLSDDMMKLVNIVMKDPEVQKLIIEWMKSGKIEFTNEKDLMKNTELIEKLVKTEAFQKIVSNLMKNEEFVKVAQGMKTSKNNDVKVGLE